MYDSRFLRSVTRTCVREKDLLKRIIVEAHCGLLEIRESD